VDAVTPGRKLAAEALGTALLVAVVVGSGIMAERLAGGNVAVALLGNTLATGAALVVLLLVFGPVSGAHLNPAVSLSFALRGELGAAAAVAYALVQVGGGVCGTLLAHVMFDMPLIAASSHARSGIGQWVGEFVATFALLAAIFGCLRFRPEALPYAVGLIISAGYWFTSSTSFANPAVTIARALTESFAGIRPVDVPAFVLAQLCGAAAAVAFFGWLLGAERRPAGALPETERRAAE
jgi:glycerol uptake facilitator-like aquaporin